MYYIIDYCFVASIRLDCHSADSDFCCQPDESLVVSGWLWYSAPISSILRKNPALHLFTYDPLNGRVRYFKGIILVANIKLSHSHYC